MENNETQINLESRNKLKSTKNYNSNIGITESLLEKYKPSNKIRILKDSKNEAKNKIAA